MNEPHENAYWVYNYDCGGNITSKVKYAYTTGTVGTAVETIPYVYGDSNWKDKLTSYDGQTITYDAIGNPTNDGIWSYTWEAGRQLKQMSTEGMSVSFKYDHNGMRVQKVVEQSWYPETTNYIYHGKLLTHMTVDYTDFDEVAHQDKLHFFYDAQSRPAKVEFNGTVYTYLFNLQGDIVGIVDNTGALVVEYKYDAWGKPVSVSTLTTAYEMLAEQNPFRYRGYVWDNETSLYYLRSRYFGSHWGRFVNEDNVIQGNLYSYSSNNAINKYDPAGHMEAAIYQAGAVTSASMVGSAALGPVGIAVVGVIAVAALVTALVYSTLAPETAFAKMESLVDLTNDLHIGIDQAYRKAINNSFIPGYSKHHIVPKAAGLADYARAVLEEAGMDPWSGPENKVLISNQFHQFIHNDFYYIGVDMIMLSVQSYADAHYPGDREMLRALVSTTLNTMALYLMVADQAVIRHF